MKNVMKCDGFKNYFIKKQSGFNFRLNLGSLSEEEMKHVFLILFMSFMAVSCSHLTVVQIIYGKPGHWTEIQKKDVPGIVTEKFEDKFNGIAVEKWYKIGKRHYGASYQKNGMLNLVVFSESGALRNEETDFREDDYYDDYEDYWDFDYYD